MSVGVSAMDRTTLRGVAFWTAVSTTLIGLMMEAIRIMPFLISMSELAQKIHGITSVAGFFVHVLSAGSLLLFLGLVHYDLMTAQRLSEHARDYLIRDLSQSSQENKSNHG